MRIFSLLALSTLASGLALCATRPETFTYVEGNLTGLKPNTGGTLAFASDKALEVRAGLTTIPVSYAAISKAELGATKAYSHDSPLYKVWSLHKRFTGKTETQLLKVEFKNEQGEEKTMTLELAKHSAPNVLSAIRSHAPQAEKPAPVAAAAAAKPAKAKGEEWWGDAYWKTTRNADSWKKPGATVAP